MWFWEPRCRIGDGERGRRPRQKAMGVDRRKQTNKMWRKRTKENILVVVPVDEHARRQKSPQNYSESFAHFPPSRSIFLLSYIMRTDWRQALFLLILCVISIQLYTGSCGSGHARRGVGSRAKRLMTLSFSHLLLISALMWSKLYCFAHHQAAPCQPAPSRRASSPWRGLLKTDHWSSAEGLPGSGHSALLTFVCLTPNYDVLRAQKTTNGFACIKHLCCSLIKGPFTRGP